MDRQCTLVGTITFFLLVLLSGCASMEVFDKDPYYQQRTALSKGRAADIEKISAPLLADNRALSSPELYPICYSYAKLKNYAKLFPCLDRLEDNVRKGDARGEDEEKLEKDMPLLLAWLIPIAKLGTVVTCGKQDLEKNVVVDMYLWRAEALIDIGKYKDAVEEGKKAESSNEKIWECHAPTQKGYRIQIRTWIGLALAFGGDRAGALQQVGLLENESGYIEIFANASEVRIQKYFGIAKIHMALRDYGKAMAALEQAKENTLDLFLQGVVNALWTVTGVMSGQEIDQFWTRARLSEIFAFSKCQFETGRITEAKTSYDKLLSLPSIEDNGDIYWVILFDRGRIAEKEGNRDQAIEFYRKAIEVIERQRSTINTEASKIGFVGDKQGVYERLIELLVEQAATSDAFDYVERSKSRALVDMLASKNDFSVAGPMFDKAKRALAQLDSLELASRSEENVNRSQGVSSSRNLVVVKDELKQSAPELSSLVTVSSVPSTEIRGLIEEKEVLVEYYYQGQILYAFILHRDRMQVVKLDASDLNDRIYSFRQAIERLSTVTWQPLSRSLYAQIWKPIEAHIYGKRVIVVAHGALHYLPFGALQNPDGEFLVDRKGLRFLPSASVLKYMRPPLTQNGARLLVLGNPDLGDPNLDLKFAEQEAQMVGVTSSTSKVLVRKDASETNFKNVGGIFSTIHFATHGKFQADDPLSSGLYLAKDAENDGLLSVGELYSMSLNADLVTLSACETGLGKITNGDDVVGLTRGFLYAGSRSIVSTLWSVDDKATGELMKSFYENLESRDKVDALQRAQIKTRELFSEPFFWAAFQLTGRGGQ